MDKPKDPEPGDIVREKKYAQPLEVTRTWPDWRQAEVVPQAEPTKKKRYLRFEEIEPYKKEGT